MFYEVGSLGTRQPAHRKRQMYLVQRSMISTVLPVILLPHSYLRYHVVSALSIAVSFIISSA